MIRPRSRCETSAPRSYRLASPGSAGLGPPSRRRPLSSTGTGGVEARRDALTAPRLTPARVTQSTTRSKSKTGSGEYVYFFFRRFVLRAPFFAADFVFVFRFFAMLPS